MFTVNTKMYLRDFDSIVGFWGGARDRYINFTEEEIDYLDACLDCMEFDSLTAVNDFIWFESDSLLEEMHSNKDEYGEEDEEEEVAEED